MMKTQTTDTDIDYIYVEMVLNKEHKYEVVSGMFQGIKIKSGSTFILLHGKKEVTNIINLRYYNVMTIEVLHKEYKDMTYLTMKAEDQNSALSMLESLYTGFTKGKSNGSLIDVTKYKNIPEDCGTVTTVDRNKTQTSSYGVGDFVRNVSDSNVYRPAKKKEITPTLFHRATGSKKPNRTSLEEMRKNIDQINDGEFVYELPKMVEDDKEDEDDSTNLYNDDSLHWA